MPLTVQYEENQNGFVFSSRHDNQPPVVGFTRDELLSSAAIALADTATILAERLQPSAFDAEMPIQAKPLREAWKRRYDDVIAEKRATAEAELRAMQIPASVRTDHFAENRNRFRGLDTATAVKLVTNADLETLSALIDGGQSLSDLNDDVWQIVRDRYLALAHVERVGMMADYQKQPKVDDLLATGPDQDAAEKAARDILARHDQRKADLADAETELLSMLKFMANVEHRSVDDVLQDALAA